MGQAFFRHAYGGHVLQHHGRRLGNAGQRDVQLAGSQVTVAIDQLQRQLELVVQLIQNGRDRFRDLELDVRRQRLHLETVVAVGGVDHDLGTDHDVAQVCRAIILEGHRKTAILCRRRHAAAEQIGTGAIHHGHGGDRIGHAIRQRVAAGVLTVVGVIHGTQVDGHVVLVHKADAGTLGDVVLLEGIALRDCRRLQVDHIVDPHGFTLLHQVVVHATAAGAGVDRARSSVCLHASQQQVLALVNGERIKAVPRVQATLEGIAAIGTEINLLGQIDRTRHDQAVFRVGRIQRNLEHLALCRGAMVGHCLQHQSTITQHIGDRQAARHHALAIGAQRRLAVQIRIEAHAAAVGAIAVGKCLVQRIEREDRRIASLVLDGHGVHHRIHRRVVVDLHLERGLGRIAIAVLDRDAEAEGIGFFHTIRRCSRLGADYRHELLIGVRAIGVNRQHRHLGDTVAGAGQRDVAIGGEVTGLRPGDGFLRGHAACAGIDVDRLHRQIARRGLQQQGLHAIRAGREQLAGCRPGNRLGVGHIASAAGIAAQLGIVVQHDVSCHRIGHRDIVIDLHVQRRAGLVTITVGDGDAEGKAGIFFHAIRRSRAVRDWLELRVGIAAVFLYQQLGRRDALPLDTDAAHQVVAIARVFRSVWDPAHGMLGSHAEFADMDHGHGGRRQRQAVQAIGTRGKQASAGGFFQVGFASRGVGIRLGVIVQQGRSGLLDGRRIVVELQAGAQVHALLGNVTIAVSHRQRQLHGGSRHAHGFILRGRISVLDRALLVQLQAGVAHEAEFEHRDFGSGIADVTQYLVAHQFQQHCFASGGIDQTAFHCGIDSQAVSPAGFAIGTCRDGEQRGRDGDGGVRGQGGFVHRQRRRCRGVGQDARHIIHDLHAQRTADRVVILVDQLDREMLEQFSIQVRLGVLLGILQGVDIHHLAGGGVIALDIELVTHGRGDHCCREHVIGNHDGATNGQ